VQQGTFTPLATKSAPSTPLNTHGNAIMLQQGKQSASVEHETFMKRFCSTLQWIPFQASKIAVQRSRLDESTKSLSYTVLQACVQ
jgi:hypothetical protein